MRTRIYSTIAISLLLILQLSSCKESAQKVSDYPYVPVPFTDVQIDGGFWLPRIETNREVTVSYNFKKSEETGRTDNFAIAGGLKKDGFRGKYYNDSDVFKIIEGAAYTMIPYYSW